MRVIFLDIDGVLNSMSGYYKAGGQKDIYDTHAEHCEVLKWVMYETCAKVVISSSWRLGADFNELRKLIAERCMILEDFIIDKTPNIRDAVRGAEIGAWLKEHPEVEEFVILDDDSDMEPHMRNLVLTNRDYGLTYFDGAKAIAQLLGKYTDPGDEGYPKWGNGERHYDTTFLLKRNRDV